MRKLFLLSSLFWFVLNVAYAQIDNSIPTPPDLQAQGTSIKILTKERLKDGTIVIRYVNRQGRTIQRRTHPSKPDEKQEWDEANPPQRPDKSNPGATDGRVPTAPGAVAGGLPDSSAGARLGERVPGTTPGGQGGATPGGVTPGRTTPEGVLPGGAPLGGVPGGVLPGGNPPDKAQPAKPTSPLDDVRKGAEGILPDNSTPGKPTSALGEAGKAAKKIAEDILEAIKNLVINTAGTGQTIGVIANITLKNNNDFPVGILPQTFYIPSDGQHQNYVGRIPEGITIPPDGTVVVPVNGVCADIHTPPVPPDESMPPVSTWVPVGSLPPGVVVDTDPPVASEPSVPPGISVPPTTEPIPVDPPGIRVPPSTEPTPNDPASGSNRPKDILLIPIVNTVPVPEFTPSDIPHITTTPEFKPQHDPDPDIIITWPGTDTPVGGTLVPGSNPEVFGPVIVSVLEAIEKAVPVIRESENFPTPFSNDSVREEKALVQQTFWVVNSILTGNEYTKEDFTGNTYKQFETATGKPVSSLTPEQKEQVDAGITDFWDAFHATGIVAKVISTESPGIEIELPMVTMQSDQVEQPTMADNDGDGVADPKAATEEESIYKCTCPDTVSFTLKVNRGNTAVLESAKTILTTADTELKPRELEIKVDKLRFGDTLSVHVSDLDINCQCANTSCDVTWDYMMNDTYCNNIEDLSKLPVFNRIKFITKPKNKKDAAITCYFFIRAVCSASGCNSCDCYYSMKLTFVDSKSKK